MYAVGIDPGVVGHQTDTTVGNQVQTVGQEDLDTGSYRRRRLARYVGGVGTAHHHAHKP
jgi:hypothetical protein